MVGPELSPDSFVGYTKHRTVKRWVYEKEKMVYRYVTYVPALYKIFEEILENAADNFHRDPEMDSLEVNIDHEANTISVYNNGEGIPVEIHHEYNVYIPEMVFGTLYAKSKPDPEFKMTTGGFRGVGAKLTNFFSTEFVAETADGFNKYKQEFTNMEKKSDPEITKCKEGENWTKVTFKPDLEKLGMKYLEEDVVVLMKTRVLEMAACLGNSVKVKLDGNLFPINSFQDYVGLYLKSAQKSKKRTLPRIHHKAGDRWEICVSLSDWRFQENICDGKFQQVSFVNSVATIDGGYHVDYIADQVTTYVMNKIYEVNKDAFVRANNVKEHLWVFVNALFDNPIFFPQTKDSLLTRQASFGSECVIPESKLKDVANWLMSADPPLILWASVGRSKDLKKSDETKTQMTIDTNNIHLFDSKGIIKKYADPEQIMKEFYPIRLEYYDRRKKHMVVYLKKEVSILENKVRFTSMVMDGKIIMQNVEEDELLRQLKENNFERINDNNFSEAQETSSEAILSDYEYLLYLPFSALTKKGLEKLKAEKEEKMKELEEFELKTLEELWKTDLDEREKKYREIFHRKDEKQYQLKVGKNKSQRKK